jgi:hypothetical protein
MPKYAIAFHSTDGLFHHKIIEMDTKESALRFFFTNHIENEYTPDEEGYNYFREDFLDPDTPLGNILDIEEK